MRDFSEMYIPEPMSGCWLWLMHGDKDGYGLLTWGGVTKRAHRLSWEISRGPIPAGLHVLHKCDNPPCVNPDHLWLGTNRQNMRDKASKGRSAKNERHGRSILTWDVVREIRRMAETRAPLEIARSLGLNRWTVRAICRGVTWKESSK